MSDCVYPDHRNPTGTRRHSFSEENRAPFYLSSAEETIPPAIPRWQLGGEQVPEMLLFWDTSAQYKTSAALLLNALGVRDPLQLTAALPMPNNCWHNKRCPPKLQCISLQCHSALLSTIGDFCITFFELSCLYHCIIKFSAHRALGASISSNLTIMHLPLNMSTLAGMPRRWKYSSFQRQKLPSGG